MNESSIDDYLDELVARYADELERGIAGPRRAYLEEVPAEVRPGLERCLKMIETGSAHPPSLAQPLHAGLALDNYELVRELGRGGMGLVWLALDKELRRPVALKLLRPGLAIDEKHAVRFRREALAIASLRHPNIVQIYGTGEAHGYHYLAMEFIEGPSFATVLEALPQDRARTADDLARATAVPSFARPGMSYESAIAELVAPVAEALGFAHDAGLVHRDIKPSNILLRADGTAVLADFGLAKGDEDPALSLTGDPIGTPYYMSPEQAYITSSKGIDHRTDIYSLGVTLFEALSGQRPFRGDSFLEVIESIRSTIPPSVRALAPTTSRNASAVVDRAMRREPEERYVDARALHSDLLSVSRNQPTDALAEAGNPLRRLWLFLRMMTSGLPFEYRSPHTLLGWPLVHIITGRRPHNTPMRVAKGWLAIGDIAYGAIASGVISVGGISFGAFAAGLFTWAGIGMGGFVFAGMGVGLLTFCGLSLGVLAIGGVAIGIVAIGGISYGVYSVGGSPHGKYPMSHEDPHPKAVEFFEETLPSLFDWFG